MSRIAKAIIEAHGSLTGEPLTGAEPIRRSMSPARKRRVWTAHGGRCEECGVEVPMFGPATVYEHRLALWVSRDDSDDNIRLLCKANCDPPKTKADQGVIAKIKRLIRKANPETRKPSTMKSRPFPKDLRKRLNGKVERREPA